MKTSTLSCTLALMTLTLACGGDDAPMATTADPDTTGGADTDVSSTPMSDPTSPSTSTDPGTTAEVETEADTDDSAEESTTTMAEPPTVISTSPEDGARGVPADVIIVVRFDTPMDTAATEAAWQSDDLPAESVTMSWNAAGDELTVTPNEPLELAEGIDPDETDPRLYTVTIGGSARSASGDTLGEDYSIEFGTMRWMTGVEVPAELDLTGTWLGSGVAANLGVLYVGDHHTNAQYKGFVSLDLSVLPSEVDEFMTARLFVYQTGGTGTPYNSLGGVFAYPLDFETVDASAFSATPWVDVGLELSNNANTGWKHVDILGYFVQAYEGDTGLSQFRLEFSLMTDDDGGVDRAEFDPESPSAIVSYLIP